MSEVCHGLTLNDFRLLTASWILSLVVWLLFFRRCSYLRDKSLNNRVKSDDKLTFGQLVLVIIASYAAVPPISSDDLSVVWRFVWIGIAFLLCRGIIQVYILWGKNVPAFFASVLASTMLVGTAAVGRLLWICVLMR